MSVFSGWRAATRIARRDAMRAKGRSALVVAMIALPVLGVTAADVSYRSSMPTAAETLTAAVGSADARYSDPGVNGTPIEQMPDATSWGSLDESGHPAQGEEPEPVDVADLFPKGSRHLTERSVPADVTTRHGITSTEIVEVRTADPLARGRIELVDGAFPDGADEIAATEPFMESAGLGIGSRVTVRGPGKTYTVTGTVELPHDLGKKALYADPGAVIAAWQTASDRDDAIVPPQPSKTEWLVKGASGVGVGWPDVLRANEKGVLVKSRQVALDPPPDSEVPMADSMSGGSAAETSAAVVTVVALTVLEIVLLAGPAFAVGARRSRRQLGLLGTCGGDRSHVRAVVLAGGAVLGGFGAVAGVAAGLGLTVLFRPLIEGWTGSRFGALEIRPWELLAIALIGLVTGILAALAPAIVAGRQSVLESLTGRRGTRGSSRVLPAVGCVTLAAGVAIAVFGGATGATGLVAGGSIVAELGVLACIPVIVGFLGRLGSRLPLAPRMALRDAARNRGRTAPAVAAVMAAVAGTVAIATYLASVTSEHVYDHIPMLTPGTVALVNSDPMEVGQLPLARAAVEQNVAVSGGRADFGRVWAGSDCSVYYEEENGCGTIELVKPAGKGHSCPLQGAGARKLAEGLSADAHKELMSSPACIDEHIQAYSFDSGVAKIVVGDAPVLTSYAKLDDPAAARALAEGTPVLLNPAYADNGRVTLKAVHTYSEHDRENRKLHPGEARTTTDRLKVYVAPAKYAATPGIRMILPQKAADRLGLHTQDYGSFYTVAHAPTDAEQQAVSAAFAQAGDSAYLQAEYGPDSQDEDVVLLILALFAGLVTLGAAAIATGLARADAEADLTTLSAVGAPPAVRRTLSGFQCLVVALTGVLLGTAAGLVPAVALRLIDLREATKAMRLQPMDSAYTPIVLPWVTIGLLAVVVPVLAGLLAAAFSGSRTVPARRAA
ncbi:FtsX-like permease family protein [Streptomyces sp. NPDC058620]|uniref:FtsX-like permease family protein n=1 Tax=Streptomyces sp. NPDC058620 TaxID=3346560 RepID=UPI00364FE79C